jgi:uncharacterized protein YcfJ
MKTNNSIRGLAGALVVFGTLALVGCGEEDAQASAVANAKVPAAAKVAREKCHDEVVTLKREPKDKDQIAGTAIGAVIGGVLGNQIGKGDGNKIATVGGAVAGGVAGNKIQDKMQDGNTYTETRQVCETVFE